MPKYNSIKKQKLRKNILKQVNEYQSPKEIAIWFSLLENQNITAKYGEKKVALVWKILKIFEWYSTKKHLKPTKEEIFSQISANFKKLNKKDKKFYFHYYRNGKSVANKNPERLKEIKETLIASFATGKFAFDWLKKNQFIDRKTEKINNRIYHIWSANCYEIDFQKYFVKKFRGWKTFAVNFGNKTKEYSEALNSNDPPTDKSDIKLEFKWDDYED